MFEKIGRAAEKAADGVSRRDFFGRFGKAALATAAVLGGVLALPGGVQAVPKPPPGYVQCCGRGACSGGYPSCQWLCNGVTVYSLCCNSPACSQQHNWCAIPAPGCVLVLSCTCH